MVSAPLFFVCPQRCARAFASGGSGDSSAEPHGGGWLFAHGGPVAALLWVVCRGGASGCFCGYRLRAAAAFAVPGLRRERGAGAIRRMGDRLGPNGDTMGRFRSDVPTKKRSLSFLKLRFRSDAGRSVDGLAVERVVFGVHLVLQVDHLDGCCGRFVALIAQSSA